MANKIPYKQSIRRLMKKWRPVLGLSDWDITLAFDETKHLASCEALPAYEQATIHFNMKLLRAEIVNNYGLEELVVHELVHCVIWHASERAVTQIGRALLRSYDRGRLGAAGS